MGNEGMSNGEVDAPSAPSLADLADRVEQLNRMLHVHGFSGGLNPAQWAALRHLARAPDGARTVSALALRQGVTPPTASETVSALVRKGMVARIPSPTDRRSQMLSVTESGMAQLAADPLHDLAAALAALDGAERVALGVGLDSLARAWQARLLARPGSGRR